MTMDFDDLPGFMLDRAIKSLEGLKAQIDTEISDLRREKMARTWHARRKQHNDKIARDLVTRGMTDENQARNWLCEQGHSWKYACQVLSAMQARVKAEKKAARDIEIFRRWLVGKEKKAALAREFGLSRATVERICRKHAENDGLRKMFEFAKRQRPPAISQGPSHDEQSF